MRQCGLPEPLKPGEKNSLNYRSPTENSGRNSQSGPTENSGSETNSPEIRSPTENSGRNSQSGPTGNSGSEINSPENRSPTENSGRETNSPENGNPTENSVNGTNPPKYKNLTEGHGRNSKKCLETIQIFLIQKILLQPYIHSKCVKGNSKKNILNRRIHRLHKNTSGKWRSLLKSKKSTNNFTNQFILMMKIFLVIIGFICLIEIDSFDSNSERIFKSNVERCSFRIQIITPIFWIIDKIIGLTPQISRKKRNKEIHAMNGNTDRILNLTKKFYYFYLKDRKSIPHPKEILEKQDLMRLDCLKHALNNMIYERNKFTHSNLNSVIEHILENVEGVKKGTNEYNYLKSEHVSNRGNYSVNVGHTLLKKSGYDLINLKYMNNQKGVDYTVFIPSFRGDPNFVGCLLQKGDSNFGHYTCLHHDIESGNLYYMDSCTGSILVKSEKQLRDILCDKKVWGIFTKKHLNYEHGWVDTWCRYVRENKNDDIYIKHLIQYYFVENKEILTIQTEQDKYNLMQFRKQSLCESVIL